MHKIFRQLLAFAGVGAIGTAAHYAVLISLVEWAKVDVTVATACGAVVGAIVNYFGNYHWTFASQRAHREAAPRFAVFAIIGALLNTGLMYVATRTLPFHYLYLQIGATAVVMFFNFVANRRYTFTAPPQRQVPNP